MRVGELVYLYLLQGRARLQAYMTYNLDSPLTWPEESLTRQVLCDESLINFHVCINPFYSETAHYADIVLPWTTYLERWDLDARASYNLKPYVGLRMPMVKPLGESKDVREFFPELARRIGGGMEKWYQYGSQEDYMRQWASNVPPNPQTGKAGLDRLMEEGAWENPDRQPFYEPYNEVLPEDQLTDTRIDEASGVVTRDGKGIGVRIGDRVVRGFATPSRKFEIRSLFVQRTGQNLDCSELIRHSGIKASNRPQQHEGHDVEIDTMPIWFQPVEHTKLEEDQLIMTSFKWNVHNHGRTMDLKWLAEIVHSNPAWLNPLTAGKFGIGNGDWVELTSYHSQMLDEVSPHLMRNANASGGPRQAGSLRVPVVLMEGIHPKAIAMSNSCGHWQYTSVATARKKRAGAHSQGSDHSTFRDPDWEENIWWEDNAGGDPARWKPNTGNGWNQNRILPVAPDPITGQQAFHSTVVTIRKIDL
jgi:anaerobic selenocysteine-containing dehydrogenase